MFDDSCSSEDDHLLPRSNNADTKKERCYPSSIYTSIVLVALVLFTSIVGYANFSNTSSNSHRYQHQTGKVTLQLRDVKQQDNSIVTIKIENEYTKRPDAPVMFPYPFLKDGAHLMEPYRESTVYTEGLSSECGVSWRLERYVDASGMGLVADGYSSNGSEFVVESKGPGKYRFQLMQQCTGKRNEFVVYVRYVRRELSTLTDRDREEFLDALYVVGTVSTEEGKKLYGERYKSQAYLSVIHLDGQDNGYFDQFHGGPGFLASHLYLQSYLEQSMQLVNPRTCLHYWEFIKTFSGDAYEAHTNNQLDGGSYTEIMTEKWFGQNDPMTGRIINGRWKDYMIPLMNDEFFDAEGVDKDKNFFPENDAMYKALNTYMHTTSPYGYLRSAWNYNPSPIMARYNNYERITDINSLGDYEGTISCDQLESTLLGFVGLSISNLTQAIGASNLHGNAHIMPGGFGGDETAHNDALLKEKFHFTDSMCIDATNGMINLRRDDHPYVINGRTKYFDCTNEAFDFVTGIQSSTKPPGTPGGIQCPFYSSYFENEEKVDSLLETIFSSSDGAVMGAIAEFSFAKKVELLKVLGDRYVYSGEMVYSSSVTDPLFWIIHGPFERILDLMLFEKAVPILEYDHVDECAGHNAESTKSWLLGYYLQDESIDVSKLTLRELQHLLNPMTSEFETLQQYVYDSAEWSYCPAVVPKFKEAVLAWKASLK